MDHIIPSWFELRGWGQGVVFQGLRVLLGSRGWDSRGRGSGRGGFQLRRTQVAPNQSNLMNSTGKTIRFNFKTKLTGKNNLCHLEGYIGHVVAS